ncbi:phosphate ABC transporter permease subunit PstC [Thermospira aquatica]|uniref:Phosphate transport system permease protein n=1 Tax=Thermospira aquatica TaxID=2828656 RepID=A0AAX3BCB4_9SPIR|nr:phosphate ABC transporter permease subunit PstC [Thermospira aquatica]URA09639.1 phosphate ABC transporter permease subunit PstC [Thermospira aquatica]
MARKFANTSQKETKNPEKAKAFSGGLFSFFLWFSVGFVALFILATLFSLFIFSLSAIKHNGWQIFIGTNWDPDNASFGGLPFITGTFLTSVLALLISLPFSLSLSIFLGEYRPTGRLSTLLKAVVRLLAGIPSVIYGMWGLLVLVPLMQKWQLSLVSFGVIPMGVGVLTASLVVAIMIIPYSTSLAYEVIQLVPQDLKEAAISLGSPRYKMIQKVIIPYASSGILAGHMLAFGRALGETMAVTMVIGNLNQMPTSLFSAGSTIASVIANQFTESTGLHTESLTELGLILFLFTIVFSFIGQRIIKNLSFER